MAKLTFNDDFNSLSLWNGSTGTWSTTYNFADPNGNGSSLPSNGEQEWYINNMYAPTSSVTPWTVANGELTLTARPVDPSIAPYLGYNQAGLPAMGSYQYTSGLIETNHSFSQTYGYFEMRAELPAGQGTWPAFWLLPADGSWPPEIDIMEMLGGAPNQLWTTLHTTVNGDANHPYADTAVANMSTGYHTFAVDWEKDVTTFYFDGKAVYSAPTPTDMNKPMYMVANLALGGSWGGAVDPNVVPAEMHIDYIRAWDSNPYTTTVATNVITASVGGNQTLVATSANDVFTFKTVPWIGDRITGFALGHDTLDFTSLFKQNGYVGTDPVTDGYVKVIDDHNGGSWIYYDTDGKATKDLWGTYVTDLVGVSPSNLNSATLFHTSDTTPSNVGQTITGSVGNDTLVGGGGNDTIDGRGGYDVLSGKAGNDHFVFGQGYGHLTIQDYTKGDVIDLYGFGANHPTITVTDYGFGVALDMPNGDSITLAGAVPTDIVEVWH